MKFTVGVKNGAGPHSPPAAEAGEGIDREKEGARFVCLWQDVFYRTTASAIPVWS